MPRRSFQYDSYGVPSLDLVIQAKGRPAHHLTGTADSGAGRFGSTVLSKKNAEELGLGASDLRETGTVTVADRKQAPCFTAKMPIVGQVLLVSDGIVLGRWGPSFYLNAIFLENADPLWGQSDFFATYEVTFRRNATPATFGLSY